MPPTPSPTWHAAAAPSLRTYLVLAFACRLPAILFADGFAFVDQQFQYVEPAWHLATGADWIATWEFRAGMRSWVYPGLLAGLFRLLLALGVDDPTTLLCAARAVHALLTLLPLWLFWLVVVRWRPLESPRLPLWLFAASGVLVFPVQPNGPALATVLAVSAGLLAAGPTRAAALAGLCLGFAFCCRFQDALFGPGICGALLLQRRYHASAWFAAGCLPGIALQGAVDVATGSAFLATPWSYLTQNLIDGAAAKWRTHPFSFYLLAGVVPVAGLWPGCLRIGLARLGGGARWLPAAAAAAGVHLLAHSLVARKALRFELPALALLTAVVAVGTGLRAGRGARWHLSCLGLAHLGLWVIASVWFGDAGAVRTALWLRAQRPIGGRIAVVGGDGTSLGGFFHSGLTNAALVAAPRTDLAPWLDAHAADTCIVVSVRRPIDAAEAARARLQAVATFTGIGDLRRGERRFVYRREPGPGAASRGQQTATLGEGLGR